MPEKATVYITGNFTERFKQLSDQKYLTLVGYKSSEDLTVFTQSFLIWKCGFQGDSLEKNIYHRESHVLFHLKFFPCDSEKEMGNIDFPFE